MFRPSCTKNKTINPQKKILSKEVIPPRIPIQTNQILITDFTFTEPTSQKKKKRCPLWMINQKFRHKNINEGDIFNRQRIFTPSVQLPPTSQIVFRYENKIKNKKLSSTKKKSNLVHFNFVRDKFLNRTINESDGEFPMYFHHPNTRYLTSSLTQRKYDEKKQGQKRSYSSSRLSKRTKERYQWKNDVEGWNTLQHDDEDFM